MENKKLKQKARSRGISTDGQSGYERHILLCTGKQETAACCGLIEGQKTWKHLNKRLKALEKEGRYIYRTEAECLMFCQGGPIAIVYPEGTWYGNVTTEVCDRIIQEHLIEGKIVSEFAIAQNPLNPLNSQQE